jgi:hypothetical protein
MAKTNTKLEFNIADAHRYFAAHCFNSAWDLIEKTDRSAEDDRLMVLLNQASIYHWSQRPDCNNQRLSIGYWQASRIQALLGNAAEARRHAETCLSLSRDLAPFYRGYAQEALARAAQVAGDSERASQHIALATALSEKIKEKTDRDLLLNDLKSI